MINLTELQMEEIENQLIKLQEVCMKCNVPMFASVVVADDEEHTEYKNITYSAKSRQIELHDDKIAKHILIANGFRAVMPRDAIELTMEGLFDE